MHGLLCCLSRTRTKPKSANSNEKGLFDAQNTAQLAELHTSSPVCSTLFASVLLPHRSLTSSLQLFSKDGIFNKYFLY